MNDIIRIDHLSKRFGEVQAVQDLSFRVKEGELFAFLGVNGAGKSTTINILCGQLAKDGGSVEIDGADPDRDPDRVRRELGVVFQNSVLDGALSVRDNLQSRAALYGIRGAAFAKRLAELAQLLDFAVCYKISYGKGSLRKIFRTERRTTAKLRTRHRSPLRCTLTSVHLHLCALPSFKLFFRIILSFFPIVKCFLCFFYISLTFMQKREKQLLSLSFFVKLHGFFSVSQRKG